ncbi:PhzF family phenazine biosynthesis protein [Tissierella creatinophila]|uniref:Putative isomerase YddE n=1 Tax=Tissierella creatinophila DSM 6911 TaxID=1123403 RepID=A0A1U7M5X2_TISCR|nr:PhzF family phenazine biosynthesis protein [Tissierella creatinophila]OLS02707.1 putative isomerase YddE [Tissierella creatinophila DSM 6911]
MDYNIYLVDAFTNEAFKGNPAGVVPDARRLNEDQMQKIAIELNASETAFVTSVDRDSYKVRYFSPYGEVDFCGHSTLATFYILALRGYIIPIESGIKTVYIHSNKKRLHVDIYFLDYKIENIVVKMGKPEEVGVIEDRGSFLKHLNLTMEDVNLDNELTDIPIIKLGSKYAIIPIKTKEKLETINMDKKMLRLKLDKLDIQGVHLFFLPEKDSSIIFARNFSNMMNLKEEAATGTANGALIYLLKKKGFINGNQIKAIQGEAMGRESSIYCTIKEKDSDYEVEVGGEGKVVLEGIINV